MVKREDVARRAGVSTAVVSYVLNNGPRPVAEATRRRVVQAIEELGYRPHAVAQALRSRRTRSIGLIVPDNVNPFFAEFAHAVEDEAFARGYSLLLGNASGDRTREETYLRTFMDRRVDCLLVVTNRSTEDVGRLREGTAPVVVMSDKPTSEVPVSSVKVDNVDGARSATEHLLWHGHREVGAVLGSRDSAPALERFAGWHLALANAGLDPDQGQVAWAEFSRAGGYAAGRELLDRPARPTALFVATDHQAIGVLRAAVDLGLDVPGDVAIVGFDGIAEAEYAVPRLATVQQPIKEMARGAIDLLLRDDDGADPVHKVYPMTLKARGSCGCPDPRSAP